MSTESKPSGSPIPGILVGFALAIAGTYVAIHEDTMLPFQKGLRESQHIDINLGMTLATIGVLIAVFPIIRLFFVAPLHDAIHERNSNLEKTFTEAETLRSELDRLRTEYERRLADTEAQAREQIQSQIREAQQLRATLIDEATQRTNALVAQAEAEIAAERTRLIGDLRSYVVDLALAAAEKVVRENMDSDKNRRLIDAFIAEAEAVH